VAAAAAVAAVVAPPPTAAAAGTQAHNRAALGQSEHLAGPYRIGGHD